MSPCPAVSEHGSAIRRLEGTVALGIARPCPYKTIATLHDLRGKPLRLRESTPPSNAAMFAMLERTPIVTLAKPNLLDGLGTTGYTTRRDISHASQPLVQFCGYGNLQPLP
jgi:hypothetical protein